ncbi:MAG: rubrerythrin family protein [Euryarchaeota archaeon]|nr:rubrerythrin family protein [Euryarchaeota archaeon]
MGKTEENLKAAFAGESQANRRYLAFAKKAEEDGYPNVARLFRAAAESETIHALNHLRVMGGVKSTAENLEAAFQGESYEKTEMYPEFISTAKEEGNSEAERTFTWAIKAEEVHAELYTKALEAVKAGKDAELDALQVCQACGYTVEGDAPEQCPVCGAKGMFREVA